MIIKERPDEFVYNLPTMNVYFDYKQLNINESVKLEVVKRWLLEFVGGVDQEKQLY